MVLRIDSRGYWTDQVRQPNGQRVTATFGRASDVPKKSATLEHRRWLASLGGQHPSSGSLTVAELAQRYVEHAEKYYRNSAGQQTGEAEQIMYALEPFMQMFPTMPAAEIRPSHLATYLERQAAKLTRATLNARLGRIKRCLRWAVAEELIPPAVLDGARAVNGVRRGRTEARESKAVLPVGWRELRAAFGHLPPTVRDMIRVQYWTGIRPGELCGLSWAEIDRTQTPWLFAPAHHKTAHHGHARAVFFGPRVRRLLAKYEGAADCIFTPRQAVAERRGAEPGQRIGGRYTTRSYRRAIEYACAAAGVEAWGPNRLRHARLTMLQRRFGWETAQAVGGHRRVETTSIYVLRTSKLAADAMEKTG